MSDESKIQPALTPEEWRYAICGLVWDHDLAYLSVPDVDNPRRPLGEHATAAFCLHGQPFGFTWEDVDALRRGHAEEHGSGCVASLGDPPCSLLSLADRIAALLPPREP